MCDRGDVWDSRLASHFGALAQRRQEGRSVFALEHGLDAREIADVRSLTVGTIGSRRERERHWLPLAVHAAEVAYQYAGDEYWPSFEEQTPGWGSSDASRHEVRESFIQFARLYRGPTPRGRWADWFTIISWPIANAILPADLQRQLAKALYLAGVGLASRLDDIDELGRYVAAASVEGSDRFQQLREQPRLLGQIALALLRPQAVGDDLLLEMTLRRLASDLESERSAAGWIRRARVAASRPVIKPAGTGIGKSSQPQQSVEQQVSDVAKLISPEVLIRFDPAAGDWGVWLKLPNLSPIAAVSPEVRGALLTSNCRAPAADAPIARGRLLFDAQEVRLSRWPEPNAPLLKFDGMAAGLETAVLRSWRGPSTPAVFRIQGDFTARRIASREVRPGHQYLVAYTDPPQALRGAPNQTKCSGVHLVLITVPPHLDAPTKRSLRGAGMLPIESSVIWPVAAVPSVWDGEGRVEWLASDTPLLAISSDHELGQLTVQSEQGAIQLGNTVAGETVFVSLPALSVGAHELIIREVPVEGAPTARTFTIQIRDPRHGTEVAGPIRMWIEPYSTDLGDLWEGSVAICLAGPRGEADMALALAARPAGDPLANGNMRVPIPLTPLGWRAVFDELLEETELASAYDESRWAQVAVDMGPYGWQTVEFERSLPPLRWKYSVQGRNHFLKLQDDHESLERPTVRYAAFGRPDVLEVVPADFAGGFVVPPASGGLYVAETADDLAAIVASPPDRFKAFSEMRNRPTLGLVSADEPMMRDRFFTLEMWSRAVLPGHLLARTWRSDAVRAIHDLLMETLCGTRWSEVERSVLSVRSQTSLERLRDAIGRADGVAGGEARRLAGRANEILGLSLDTRVDQFVTLISSAGSFAERPWQAITRARGGGARRWTAEFYLRLATDPAIAGWAGNDMKHGLELAGAWGLPLRVARYIAVAGVVATENTSSYPPLFDQWEWERQ